MDEAAYRRDERVQAQVLEAVAKKKLLRNRSPASFGKEKERCPIKDTRLGETGGSSLTRPPRTGRANRQWGVRSTSRPDTGRPTPGSVAVPARLLFSPSDTAAGRPWTMVCDCMIVLISSTDLCRPRSLCFHHNHQRFRLRPIHPSLQQVSGRGRPLRWRLPGAV